jgi:methylenetetrahydrofolate reductase (NADPH)
MRIDALYALATEPVFSFELFPPRTPEGERSLWQALPELQALQPGFVSVTYGAGGSTRDRTLEIVRRIREEHALEVMHHFTCVGASVVDLRRSLEAMASAGVQNVLALRGDPPAGQEDWTPAEGGLEHSRELIELIDDHYPFAIGAACFPETHVLATSPEDDLRHLKAKVEAGASFLVTQLFFDNRVYFDFVARAREIGIAVPIVPGIWPITNVEQIERVAKLSAASIPEQLGRELRARVGDDAAVFELGVAYATLQCAELLAAGAPGIHFYTLNRVAATRAVLGALRLMEPWRALDDAYAEAA